jgi:hypothetical protein
MSVRVPNIPLLSGAMSRTAPIALIMAALVLSGCASHHERGIPNWGGNNLPPPPVGQQGPIFAPPAQNTGPIAPATFTGRTTFTQGCTGGYSVRDTRTNREISSGRAFNSGQGLIVLDHAGRQVRALSSGGANMSVLFLPDCNCTGNNQSGAVSPSQTFAATAPTGAACTAG